MKRCGLYLLFLFFVAPLHLAAQQTRSLQGHITDGDTGQPLAGAHVFLSGTMQGTTTDTDGHYHLAAISLGLHEVTVSMVGYALAVEPVQLTATSHPTLDIPLTPTIIQMEEVFVSAERPEDWAGYLQVFERYFLGTTQNASRCEILNPEVLNFAYDEETRMLSATSAAPLVIENWSLGYRIHYYLRDFRVQEGNVRYLGNTRFEELVPRSRREGRRWERRRQQAYEGSPQHFLRTVIQAQDFSDVLKEGFDAQVIPDLYANPNHQVPLQPQALLRQTDEPHINQLTFSDFIQIVYKPDVKESHGPVLPGQSSAQPAETYTSWIVMNDRLTTIDQFGHLYDPYAVTVYGRWSTERVADALPREYGLGEN